MREPEDDDPRVLCRRICSNVAESLVQSHEYPILAATCLCDLGV